MFRIFHHYRVKNLNLRDLAIVDRHYQKFGRDKNKMIAIAKLSD